MPVDHGAAALEVVTRLTSRPRRRDEIVTVSPSLCVKPRPGSSAILGRREQRAENSAKPSG